MLSFKEIALSALCLTACAVSTANSADIKQISSGWRNDLTLQHRGQTRFYRVYIPETVQPKSPTVLLLHGGSQSMRQIFRPRAGGTQAWLDIADREGVILVVPNGTNIRTGDTDGDRQSWNDARVGGRRSRADDVGFILSLLNRVETRYPVDPKRVYATGSSNGGMMTYRLLIEAPYRFAAGAAFVAGLPDVALPQPSQPKPLMMMNSTNDPLMPWQGGQVAGGGAVRSAQETVAWWIRANSARRASPTVLLPDLDKGDHCRIKRTLHLSGQGRRAPVLFYTLQGGGHAMPSRLYSIRDTPMVRRLIGTVCRDAEGAELAWRFLRRY